MEKPIYLTEAGRRQGEILEARGTMPNSYKRSTPLHMQIVSIKETREGYLKVVTKHPDVDHRIEHVLAVA